MYQLSTFLTAAGLTAAVTLLWTQLWFNHAEEAKKLKVAAERERETWEALFGLAWAEVAVFTLLMALAWAIVWSVYRGDRTSPVAVGLFIAGLVITIIAVGESLHGVLYKSRRGESIDSALFNLDFMDTRWRRSLGQLYALLWVVAIIGFTVWAVNGPHEKARPYLEVIRFAVPTAFVLFGPLVCLIAPLLWIYPRLCHRTPHIICYSVVWIAEAACMSLWIFKKTGESTPNWRDMIHALPLAAIVVAGVLLPVTLSILRAILFRSPNDKVRKRAKGTDSHLLLLEDDWVRIRRKSLFSRKQDKDIPLSQITDVDLKEIGFMLGALRFSFVGDRESELGLYLDSDNHVKFDYTQERAFAAIKKAIEERIIALRMKPRSIFDP